MNWRGNKLVREGIRRGDRGAGTILKGCTCKIIMLIFKTRQAVKRLTWCIIIIIRITALLSIRISLPFDSGTHHGLALLLLPFCGEEERNIM